MLICIGDGIRDSLIKNRYKPEKRLFRCLSVCIAKPSALCSSEAWCAEIFSFASEKTAKKTCGNERNFVILHVKRCDCAG